MGEGRRKTDAGKRFRSVIMCVGNLITMRMNAIANAMAASNAKSVKYIGRHLFLPPLLSIPFCDRATPKQGGETKRR